MGKHIIWVPLAILAALLAVLLWLGFQAHPQDTPESSPETTAAPQEDQAAPPDPTDWRLMLVNPWNAIPQGYQPELVTVENGYQVDQRCASALTAMLADCRAAGYSPLIRSAYRTQAQQTTFYQNLVQARMAQGLSQTEAQKQAATEVAVPGTSEHRLGLAVDLVDASYQVLDEAQASTPAQQWLMEHCWAYGFILRYPAEKQDITGIIYEPWHYRYVGRDHAQAIRQSGQCLEEFLQAEHP